MRILFVCHGNICRSPMAEFYMKKLVKENGVEKQFEIKSAATSTEEIGNPIYPPALKCLKSYGIITTDDDLGIYDKQSTQVKRSDYDLYDVIVIMDDNNRRNIMRIFGSDPDNKIHKLLEYVGSEGNVADPWYTGDFEATFRDVEKGCKALLKLSLIK